MDRTCGDTSSNSSYSKQKLDAAFVYLNNIITSKGGSSKSKSTAWRQQTLVSKCFGGNLSNDLTEHLWSDYRKYIRINSEIEHLTPTLLNVNFNGTLLFPNLNDVEFQVSPNENEEMFHDIVVVDNSNRHLKLPQKQTEECADNKCNMKKTYGMSSKTMEHFLQRNYIPDENPKMYDDIVPDDNSSQHMKLPKKRTEEYTDKGCNIKNKYGTLPKTMENFLQRSNVPKKNAEPSFYSARQLLAAQGYNSNPQSSDFVGNDQFNVETKKQDNQRYDIGFNFAATKKSLGPLGRLANSTRKNFISPVRNKSSDDGVVEKKIDSELATLLLHPALKNVDLKMVELISNEIIHKFKPVDWNEIAGLDYAKSIIKEAVVYPLLRPDIFTGLRRPPKGILLFGPPGTGKTLIGKCIASQSSATFFSISSSSLTSKWMGEGEKMVRALFAVAVVRQPSTEFLVRLDGAATSEDDRVLIIGATNRPQELDEAVRRRFVKRLYVPLPEENARTEILINLLKTVENNLNLNDIKEISQLAEGYSGSDMDSLCREASMEPLRSLAAEDILNFNKDNLRPVNVQDFYSALKKIRPSVSGNDLIQYVDWNKTYGSSY
ncbi:hypothetical protein DOY81_006678 [Sarcophaga bullata]|nr:hypothetical protein DOY81_006678 [Sarcophaga bullata]